MSEKKTLSIIIPTFNEEKFLPKVLSDLTKQGLKNFEVLIVDGRSQDRTIDYAKKFKKKLDLKVIVSDKRNVAYQRNLGGNAAKGGYLVFIDADVRVPSGFTRKIHEAILNQKGLIFLPVIIPQEKKPSMTLMFEMINLLIEFSQMTKRPFSPGGTIIIERNFFHHIGGFDESLFMSEDHHLVMKSYQYGVRAKIIKGLRIKFSLRRFKKEGEFVVFSKYLIAGLQYFLKGRTDKKLFNYQMGGHIYNDSSQNKVSFAERFFKDYLKRLKRNVKF